MRVTAALAFWNEAPRDLYACIKGISQVADRLVAVDGAYRRYPGATVKSPAIQIAAIKRAAGMYGLELALIQPDELWAGQLEKRTFLLREAARDSDWVIVVDADHIIHTDRVAARSALEAMPPRVRSVGVDFVTPVNEDRDPRERSASNWHASQAGQEPQQLAVIFRALPDFEVRKKHWMYYGHYLDQPVELQYGGTADAQIGVEFVIEHMTQYRTEDQILAGRAFLNDREMVKARTGQEDDVPGLPAPRFDYETVPYAGPLENRVPKVGWREAPHLQTPNVNARPKFTRIEPNLVLTLSEAESALRKGYPVRIRRRERELVFTKPLESVTVRSVPVGSTVLARVRGMLRIGKVQNVEPGSERFLVRDRRGAGWTRKIVSVAVE